MKNLIIEFMNEYLNNSDEFVNSNEKYFKLNNLIVDNIKSIVGDHYYVKGSCGQTRKAQCPWICIFNKDINKTASAKEGIYCAILFKSDMSGFYLSLCLGMESFKNMFKSDWEDKLEYVANYFRERISSNIFSLSSIDLNVTKNTRGYGYELSNIIAKYYSVNDKCITDLENDLNDLIKIYDDIYDSMSSLSYLEVLSNILSYNDINLVSLNDFEIEKNLLKESGLDNAEFTTLTEINIPQKREKKYIEITTKRVKKRDYETEAKKQIRNGLLGEQLVIEYEKEKMIKNNRADLISKIKRASEFDDTLGYDIESFDFDEKGNEYKIFIEVKTTEGNEKNVFYISANEKKKMDLLQEKYYIYRVANTNKHPVFYKINGKEFYEKFELIDYNYVVELI